MKRRMRNTGQILWLMIIVALLFSACEKKSDETDQTETASSLQGKIVGKWRLIKGLTTEYDAMGNIVRQEDVSGTTPIPIYDFREDNTLYLTDYRGEMNFSYTPVVGDDGRSKIVIDGDDDYEITIINETDMKWFKERKLADNEPGNIRRAVAEVEFKK